MKITLDTWESRLRPNVWPGLMTGKFALPGVGGWALRFGHQVREQACKRGDHIDRTELFLACRQRPKTSVFDFVVIPDGIEPPTYSLGNCRSILLSYGTTTRF